MRSGGLGGRWPTFVLVSGLALLAGCRKEERSQPAPSGNNVLLVTLDTTRTERLSCYGNPAQTSPNLDALARDGVKFDLAIAQAGVTPVSHASIMTGLNPYRHKLRVLYAADGYRLSDTVPTLVTVLKDAGWRTGAFLSSFTVSEFFGFDRGFEVFDNGLSVPVDEQMRLREDGDFYGCDLAHNQRRSDDTTDSAIRWLGQTDRPFFAWVHYWDPHDPDKVPPDEIVARFRTPNMSPQQRRVALYDAEVFYMDSQFGRLIQTLKDIGVYDNTVIVVVADHGQGLADGKARHGWWRHRLLYQEQIRVPLLVRLPGGPTGRTVAELVRTIDIYPTVLEALPPCRRAQPAGPYERPSRETPPGLRRPTQPV
jgi:arylsulfatase A-like enzyme